MAAVPINRQVGWLMVTDDVWILPMKSSFHGLKADFLSRRKKIGVMGLGISHFMKWVHFCSAVMVTIFSMTSR